MNDTENKYRDITELYTLSDELLETVTASTDPEAQLELVEPLVEIIADSADVLSDEYIGLIEGKPARKQTAKAKVEGALRRAYIALNEFSVSTKDARNTAHAVVKKIKRQLEQVITHFVGFITLSLDRIMQKADIEALKLHHASIALMLHQLGQGAH
jgi:hypothetical protein